MCYNKKAMDIFLQFLLLILGFVLLIKGADFLVDGASGIARKFKISEAVIGMTIVAFGTSAPEISVAFQSFAAGATDVTLGDIVGCAVSNILLLIGLAAIIRPIKITKTAAKKDIPFYIFIIITFVALILWGIFTNGSINRIGGGILMALFCVFLFNAISTAKKTKADTKKVKKIVQKNIWFYILLTLGGLGMVILGSDFVVESAATIAANFGVSERIIAMTIVALGTSLPELVTTIIAAKKNEQELLIGNAVGTNVFNITFVLGLPTLIYGNLSVTNFGIFDLISMTVAALALVYVIRNQKDSKITRGEGIAMLSLFAVYYTILLILGLNVT